MLNEFWFTLCTLCDSQHKIMNHTSMMWGETITHLPSIHYECQLDAPVGQQYDDTKLRSNLLREFVNFEISSPIFHHPSNMSLLHLLGRPPSHSWLRWWICAIKKLWCWDICFWLVIDWLNNILFEFFRFLLDKLYLYTKTYIYAYTFMYGYTINPRHF